jgi:hypothetical protein
MGALPQAPSLPIAVSQVLRDLRADASVLEVWLIGSRAAGCAAPESDWDLLVFSSAEPVSREPRADGVDVLWSGPSGAVLLEGMSATYSRDLSDYEWHDLGAGRATYRGRKFTGAADAKGIRDASVPLQVFTAAVGCLLWKRGTVDAA